MRYTPTELPDEYDPQVLMDELRRIRDAFDLVAQGRFEITYVEPTNKRDGMLVYASGAPDWNPGSGAGFYERRGGSWVKL